MQNPTGRDDLIASLLSGSAPDTERIDLSHAVDALACSAVGHVDSDKARKVEAALRRLSGLKQIQLIDSGRKSTHEPLPLMYVLGKGNTRSFGGSSIETIVWEICISDLREVSHMLKAEGLWSELGDVLCGLIEPTSKQTAEPLSRVPLKSFMDYAEGKWKGTSRIDSLCKNRNRPSPGDYAAAFNPDGTVNQPKFIEIAQSHGEWDDGASRLQTAVGSVFRR